MKGFIDEVLLEVSSGDGGDGSVSFRREKYVPKGGPDGGDGGRGGAVIFKVKNNVKTLSHLKKTSIIKAENGKPGRGKRMHGRDGQDAIIYVPLGTIVRSAVSKEIFKDFSKPNEEWLFLEGGVGGKGNWHFRSSTRQAPRIATPGQKGLKRKIICELKLIADIGLVGLPNAGKSTLLSVLTNAKPKIGDYPFTTLVPNLGVLNHKGSEIIIADIPGLIENASKGAGLGFAFLKHLTRTRLLVFLLDATNPNPVADFQTLLKEIRSYSEELYLRQRLVLLTKIDCPNWQQSFQALKAAFPVLDPVPISSKTYKGIEELKDLLLKICSEELECKQQF